MDLCYIYIPKLLNKLNNFLQSHDKSNQIHIFGTFTPKENRFYINIITHFHK
jgi:hypothetical protein